MTSFTIFPLGDSAVTLDLGNTIDELHNIKALAIYDWLQANRFPGFLDCIVAYSSVSVFYDPAVLRASGMPGHQGAAHWVEGLLRKAVGRVELKDAGPSGGQEITRSGGHSTIKHAVRAFRIPVCYEQEFAPDLASLAARKGLTAANVIELHCARVYRVYMIGFLPGFSYLGTLDERLQFERKERPVPVAAGGVGIAGMQTGIYPLNSPGGWQIIGRTPLKLFDPAKELPVLLQPGDQVQFDPISSGEFRELSGRPI